MAKSRDAFRTISEVAEWLDTPAHVLRFWESKFTQVKPVKRAGGRRYYRPDDMMLLSGIKALLHDQGLTIKGAQKLLREKGVKHVSALGDDPDAPKATDDDVIEGVATEVMAAPEAKSVGDVATITDDTTPEPDAADSEDPGADIDAAAPAEQEAPPAPKAPKLTINFGPGKKSPVPDMVSPPVDDTAGTEHAEAQAPTEDASAMPPDADTSGDDASEAMDAPEADAPQAEAEAPRVTAEVVPFNTRITLDSSRRTGRIPALPTNPGAFARPGVLSALVKSRRDLAGNADRFAPLVQRLRTQAEAMGRAVD